MDQLDIVSHLLVCGTTGGRVGNDEFPEPSILSDNFEVLSSKKTLNLLQIMREHKILEKKKIFKTMVTSECNRLKTAERQMLILGTVPILEAHYLLTTANDLILRGSYLDAARFLEAAEGLSFQHAPLHALIHRELADCYAVLGWYRKCAQLANRLMEKIKQSNDEDFDGKLAKSYPNPSAQGTETFSTESWEKELFGTNNSRSLSCRTRLSDGSLVTTRDFYVGDVIFIEYPIVGYVAETRGQCNVCLFCTTSLIPCQKCVAVFYCSAHCREQDLHFHMHECCGYKILFFPLVNGVLPLRLLVKALDILKDEVLVLPKANYPTDVLELWKTLLLGCEKYSDFKVMLEYSYDYCDLNKTEYRVQLDKTSTIFSYIMFTGSINRDYGLCFTSAGPEARDVFLASLLLRFSILTMLKSASFTYENIYGPRETNEPPQLIKTPSPVASLITFDHIYPRDECSEEDAVLIKRILDTALIEIIEQGNGDDSENVMQPETAKSPLLSSSRCCSNIQNFWNACVQQASEDNQEGDPVAEHNLIQMALSYYCAYYYSTYADYTTHLNEGKRTINQYHGMYRFSVDMQHSCQPNTVAILLNNGTVAFRALRTIQKGDELSYFKGKCNGCNECRKKGGATRASINAVRCAECRFKIGKPAETCRCGAYTTLTKEMDSLIQYLKVLEMNIANTTKAEFDDRKALASLMFFNKLWKSIFLNENNSYLLINFKYQLRVRALRGVLGYCDVQLIINGLNRFLTSMDSGFESKFELYYCNAIDILEYSMTIFDKYVRRFGKNNLPTFFMTSLRMLDILLAICTRARNIFETYMQHEYWVELVYFYGTLKKMRFKFTARFTDERLTTLRKMPELRKAESQERLHNK